MLPASLLLETDRWLSRPVSGLVRPFVTLNFRPGTIQEGMAWLLADYLNGLDDESGDGWKAFGTDDLMELVTQPLQATGGRPLAPPDGCTGCKCPGADCGSRKKYKAAVTLARQMARRGGTVITMPGACRATRDYGHGFHVWFECSLEHRLQRIAKWHQKPAEEWLEAVAAKQEDWVRSVFGPHSAGCGLFCHLTVNIDQFGDLPVVQIVGDTVLEWAASRSRQARHEPAFHNSAAVPDFDARVVPFPQPKPSLLQ
jgi:hypothetical protein